MCQEVGAPDSTGLGKVQVAYSYENRNEHPGYIQGKEFFESCKNSGFSRRTLLCGSGYLISLAIGYFLSSALIILRQSSTTLNFQFLNAQLYISGWKEASKKNVKEE
jgi:hypothetical protein